MGLLGKLVSKIYKAIQRAELHKYPFCTFGHSQNTQMCDNIKDTKYWIHECCIFEGCR